MRVRDADPGADREQPLRLGDARHADVDGQRDALRAAGGEPRRDRAGVEAELGRHVRWRTRALASSASSSGSSAMNAWPCG